MKIKTVLSIVLFSILVPASPAFSDEVKTAEKGKTTVVNVEASKVQAMLKADPKIVIVDIRTPEEFAEGHLANARNINFSAPDFKEELGKLDRDKTYLMHCRSGGRSTQSLKVWKELGFKRVVHLNKGVMDAEEAGIPLVKGKPKK